MAEQSIINELLEEVERGKGRSSLDAVSYEASLQRAVVELLRRERERKKAPERACAALHAAVRGTVEGTEVPAPASIGDMAERAQAGAAKDSDLSKLWELEAAACGAILAQRRLGAMRQLAEYAMGLVKGTTEGPWGIGSVDGRCVTGEGRVVCAAYHETDCELTMGDAKFISAARTLLPIFAEMVLAMTEEAGKL